MDGKLIRSLIAVLALSIASWAQGGRILAPVLMGAPAVVNANPGLVNFRGAPSTEADAMGTKANNTCATDAYCTHLVDPSVSGNTIVVGYTYKDASGTTAHVPTVTDDKSGGSSTYTCIATEGNDASSPRSFAGICYSVNVAAGIREIHVTWAVTTLTQVAAWAAQFYNVTAFDVSGVSGSASNATAWNSGAMTTTANGDLVCVEGVGTGTRTNVAAFSAGAGLTTMTGQATQMQLADLRDAFAVQCGIQTTAGSITPSITAGTTNHYAAAAVSFKAGSSGTAPSGMYIAHLYTVNSAAGLTSGNFSYQFPTQGNTFVNVNAGFQMYASAISDGTNTWSLCGLGTPNNINTQTASSCLYAANATPGLLAITMTNTYPAGGGNGDIGPAIFADIVGGATTQTVNHASIQADPTATGATDTPISNFAPGASAGICVASDALSFNTIIGCTAPTGCEYDLNTVGGQSLSGPSLPDQNNGGIHWAFSSNTPGNITYSLTNSATALNYRNLEIACFQAPAATKYPTSVKRAGNNAGSGTTVSLTNYAPVSAGDTLAILVSSSGACGTFSISDGGTNTYTAVDGPTSLNGRCNATFYAKNISASTVTITATEPSGTLSIMLEEMANVSTTAPLDQHNLTSVTASGHVITGTSVTTTSANEVLFEGIICAGVCNFFNSTTQDITAGATEAPWTILNSDGGTNITGYMTTGATGTFAANAIDNSAGAGETVGTMTFKQ